MKSAKSMTYWIACGLTDRDNDIDNDGTTATETLEYYFRIEQNLTITEA
jgi:hypothetical protein